MGLPKDLLDRATAEGYERGARDMQEACVYWHIQECQALGAVDAQCGRSDRAQRIRLMIQRRFDLHEECARELRLVRVPTQPKTP